MAEAGTVVIARDSAGTSGGDGPIVGAAVIVTMQNYLASFGDWVTIIQGLIFVVSVL